MNISKEILYNTQLNIIDRELVQILYAITDDTIHVFPCSNHICHWMELNTLHAERLSTTLDVNPLFTGKRTFSGAIIKFQGAPINEFQVPSFHPKPVALPACGTARSLTLGRSTFCTCQPTLFPKSVINFLVSDGMLSG